jgi:fatty acyl-CoA reductase
LITGCTGFLGKVILEKVLRTCPDVKKIFVMVRPKRNVEPMARVKYQILQSECFKRLRLIHGKDEFVDWAQSKIHPIQGDLIIEHLGLSAQDRAIVTNEVDVIINSAASVNFDDPLKEALQINYFGCQRMLQLAKECTHLSVFTHISTAYVNCNRTGYIEEKIYDDHLDQEAIVTSIMAKDDKDVQDNEKKIIGEFPNTYTFTKNLAEK